MHRQHMPSLATARHPRVPDHAPILDADIIKGLVDLLDLADTLVKRGLGPEHSGITLHGLLHRQPDLRCWLGTVRGPDLVQKLNRLDTGLVIDLLVRLAWSEGLFDVVGASAAEDDDVQERVGAETIRAVYRDTSGLTSSIKTGDNLVFTVLQGYCQ